MCAAAGGERNFAPGGQILALSGPRDPDFSGSLKAPRRILASLRTLSLKFKGRRTCNFEVPVTTPRRNDFFCLPHARTAAFILQCAASHQL